MCSSQEIVIDDRTGFFSEVWRGSWQGIPVAIKQLDPMADKKVKYNLFSQDVESRRSDGSFLSRR